MMVTVADILKFAGENRRISEFASISRIDTTGPGHVRIELKARWYWRLLRKRKWAEGEAWRTLLEALNDKGPVGIWFESNAISFIARKDRPERIVMCGSSRFVEIMAVCAWLLERDEGAITTGLHLLPAWYPNCPENHLAEHEGCAEKQDELHLRKIDDADTVFVVDYGEYIGESTTRELKYAYGRGKKIRLFTEDPVGDAVEKMIAKAGMADDHEPGEGIMILKCPCCASELEIQYGDDLGEIVVLGTGQAPARESIGKEHGNNLEFDCPRCGSQISVQHADGVPSLVVASKHKGEPL